jgi:phage terminase large subunit GpA-like protein
MDLISLDDVEVISWQKCARIGYTKIIVAAEGYFIEHKHRNVAVWQPTDGDAQDFVKDEVDTMLRDVPVVGAMLRADPEKKSKHNTIQKKSFFGSVLDIKGGKSSKNFRRMTKDVGIYDELSGFDRNIDNQGDATSLGDKRLTQSPFPKSIRGSTPTRKGLCQIEQSISHADMRFHRFIPCLECDGLQELSWSKIKFDNNDPSTTRHECEFCGHGAVYSDYQDMDALGVWRDVEWIESDGGWSETGYWIDESSDEIILRDAAGDATEWPIHIGLWIWGAYSYELTWPKMVSEFLSANEEKKVGAIEKLITFTNTRWGETWEDEGESADNHALYKRREHYVAPVPAGVQYLTAFVDVQDDRFEYEVCGWGFGEESWSIDYVRLYGDLSKGEIWNILAEKLRQQYADTSGVLIDIKLVGIDSGGHFTDEVYGFSRSFGCRWVIPTKGSSQRNQPIASFPRKPNARRVYLTSVGTDTAKELIYRRYQILNPGAGYCHYPVNDDYDETYFKQATTEKKIKRYTRGVPYYVWDAGKRRNEALDCRVGNLVMIRILQSNYGVRLVEYVVDEESGTRVPVDVQPPVHPKAYVKNGIQRRRSNYL